jgi:hypothetical protein
MIAAMVFGKMGEVQRAASAESSIIMIVATPNDSMSRK